MQSSSQIIIINKPTSSFFTGRMPFLSPNQQCQSTEVENITFHGLAYPKLTWGLPTFSLTTKGSWLPWGRLAMPLIGSLMPVPQTSIKIITKRTVRNLPASPAVTQAWQTPAGCASLLGPVNTSSQWNSVRCSAARSTLAHTVRDVSAMPVTSSRKHFPTDRLTTSRPAYAPALPLWSCPPA